MGLLENTPVVTADGTVNPTAPSLLQLGDWRQAFGNVQMPQPPMPASPYMQTTMVGNTPTYGIDPAAFQGLLAGLMPPAPIPASVAPTNSFGLLAADTSLAQTPIPQAIQRRNAMNWQLFGSSANRGYAR